MIIPSDMSQIAGQIMNGNKGAYNKIAKCKTTANHDQVRLTMQYVWWWQ